MHIAANLTGKSSMPTHDKGGVAMKTAMIPRALLITLAAAAMAMLMVIGGGTSSAAPVVEGSLLLDSATGDNTDVSIGTVTRELCSVTSGTTIHIDVVAQSASDWAGMDYLVYFPSPAVLDRPGPGDAGVDLIVDPLAGFDFVIFPAPIGPVFGSNNLLSTAAGSAVDYSPTQTVPSGASPRGISQFDNTLTGESGSGGMSRISLDTSGLATGQYTILLSQNAAFAGGVHSDNSAFNPDNYGAFKLAIGEACKGDSDADADHDDDDDGVSDLDEIQFGSDPNDQDSIPESAAWVPVYNGPTCSDGVDNDQDGFTDGKDIDCPPPPAPSFDKTMDLEAALPASLEITSPVSTQWHELSPNLSEPWHLTTFTDDGDGRLGPDDEIGMVHKGTDGVFGTADDGPEVFFAVEDLTLTVFLTEKPDLVTELGRELLNTGGDPAKMQAAIDDPLGSFWHEVFPNLSETWHLSSFSDEDSSGDLSAGDQIDMTNLDTNVNKDYRVDDISIDILLTTIPTPGDIPECGPGVDLSGPAGLGLFNELFTPTVSDGSGLLCHYSSTFSTAGSSLNDDCIVSFPCTTDTVTSFDRAPSTVQIPQPAERALSNPAVTILNGPTLDFATDASVNNGAVVGFIDITIGTDLGFLGSCSADLPLAEFLFDATIDHSTATGSPADLFSPFSWPLQLDAEVALVEASFDFDGPGPLPSAISLYARAVTFFDIVPVPVGPDVPLNILYWQFNPAFGELVPGEGAGGFVTQSFTSDPVPEGGPVIPLPASGASFCTPFEAETTIFGDSLTGPAFFGSPAGGDRMRTCLAAGTHPSVSVIDPDALNAAPDAGQRIDIATCSEHDSRVVRLNRPASDILLSDGEDAIKPFALKIQNQSGHTDDIRVRVQATAPPNCTVNGNSGSSIVFDEVRTLDAGHFDTISAGELTLTFNCSVVTDGAVFAVKADVDHDADGDPLQLDDDDNDTSDNSITKTLFVKAK